MKIGVVGLGLRGGLAFLAHRPEEGCELVAAADLNPEALAKFQERAGEHAFVTTRYQDLMERGLDAVFVLTPDFCHAEHACAFLKAGVPVYLEKPMAIHVEDCDRVLRTAKDTGTKLYLGHNMRHFAVVRKMKEWIDAGLIGEVKTAWCRHFVSYGGEAYYQDWHADRSKSTGLLLQKGSHDLDVLHHLCGSYSSRVTGMGDLMVYGEIAERLPPGQNHPIQFKNTWPPKSLKPGYSVIDVEDVNMVLMKLENGVLASYQHCMFSPDAWRNYTVIGTEGRIENFGDGPGGKVVLWDHARFGQDDGDLVYHIPDAKGGHGGSDNLIVSEFLRFVKEGGPTKTSPIGARMAVATGVAATESVRAAGVPIQVQPLDPDLRAYFDSGQLVKPTG